MKAVRWMAYGPPEVLEVAEIAKPVPEDDEVLVRVHATTVTAGDCEMRSLNFPAWLSLPMRLYTGIRRPARVTTLGMALAGEIEAVGSGVKRWRAGQRVAAATGMRFGSYAEYAVLPADGVIAEIPDDVTCEHATQLPIGGMEALAFVRRSGLQSGDRLLVIGAGGTIGTFSLQLARNAGAEVVAVDAGPKLELVRELGAQRVVDYTSEKLTRSGEKFDVILDVVGSAPLGPTMRLLNSGGRLFLANPRLHTLLRGGLWSLFTSRKVQVGAASEEAADLAHLLSLVSSGDLEVVLDRSFTLDEVADAHRHAESGSKIGNIVVAIA